MLLVISETMDVRLEQIGNYAVMIMEKLVIVEKKKIQRQKEGILG